MKFCVCILNINVADKIDASIQYRRLRDIYDSSLDFYKIILVMQFQSYNRNLM